MSQNKTGDNIEQSAKNAVNDVKTASNIAKKAAAGNYAGAAFDAAKNPQLVLKVAFGAILTFLLPIIMIITVCFVLPIGLVSSLYGTGQDAAWAADEKLAISEAYDEISKNLFYDDILEFFETGNVGDSNKTFKSDVAQAKDKDSLNQYLGISNSHITILNEIYRLGARNAGTSAEKKVKATENECRKKAVSDHNDVTPDRVTFSIEGIVEDTSYIKESIYLLCVNSVSRFSENSISLSTRKMLDAAFELTGARKSELWATPKCWTIETNTDYAYRSEYEIIGWEQRIDPITKLPIRDEDGNIFEDPIYGFVGYVDIVARYSVRLNEQYDKQIEEMFNMTDESLLNLSKVESETLFKTFYSFDECDIIDGTALPLNKNTYRISSPFGKRDAVIDGDGSFHNGVDLATSSGSPIYAVRDGQVTSATSDPNWGNYVVIQHADGHSTYYGHCLSLNVSVGDSVAAGEVIAQVGATGALCTGPHVHFEYRIGNKPENPVIYIPAIETFAN